MNASTETAMKAPETVKARNARWIAAGRAELRRQLEAAEAMGGLYYLIPHVSRSGMERRIVLFYGNPTFKTIGACDPMVKVWPEVPESIEREIESASPGSHEWSLRSDRHRIAHDLIARDWGFSFKHRAFTVSGCGMDMAFWLVDHLATLAGIRDGRRSYANRVRTSCLWSE